MLANVKSAALFGIDGYVVDIEVDISSALPSVIIVGLPNAAVKEASERVKAAVKNSSFHFPIRRITVNMAPADTRKKGSVYDLAIAIGILIAAEEIKQSKSLKKPIIIGELSLDGSVRPVTGVLPMLLAITKDGDNVILPYKNLNEALNIKNINIYPVQSLYEAVSVVTGIKKPYRSCKRGSFLTSNSCFKVDFIDVKGQDGPKRALEIAVAGGHNILFEGPPGCGKTMLAKRIPTIMPDLTYEEAIDITKIYSAADLLSRDQGLISTRPFRSPHHTVTMSSLIGGGRFPQPGEISLAHNGVLFLDELTEFKKDVIELLRQPLEDGLISISRVNGRVEYPAQFILAASMNPCPCGYLTDPFHECNCSPADISRYLNKLSGPMLDRFDIQVNVEPVPFKDLVKRGNGESSDIIRQRVNKARKVQYARYKNDSILCNSQLNNRLISRYCYIDDFQKKILKQAFDKMQLSARAYDKILKVARTIADLDGREKITNENLLEAIQFRAVDRRM